MRRYLLICFACSAFAQTPTGSEFGGPCYTLTVWPGYPGVPQAMPSIRATLTAGTVSFACANLAAIPALTGVTCPLPITLPAQNGPNSGGVSMPIGGMIYFGLTSTGLLHIAGPMGPVDPSICPPPSLLCVQDIFPQPGIGEFAIATCLIGSVCTQQWTGTPAIPPVVMGIGAGNCTAASSLGSITISCPLE
jgi:hypothetical protein